MRFSRRSLWIPCLLAALALVMLALAWRLPRSPTLAEHRAVEAQRLHSEALARVRAENARRDSILRPIQEELERGRESGWAGEYVFRRADSGGYGRFLLLGTTVYAWMSVSDVRVVNSLEPAGSPEPEPELWPEGTIEEHGRFSVEGDRIRLQPAGKVGESLPHELKWKRDEQGRHVRVVGDSRWLDASVDH